MPERSRSLQGKDGKRAFAFGARASARLAEQTLLPAHSHRKARRARPLTRRACAAARAHRTKRRPRRNTVHRERDRRRLCAVSPNHPARKRVFYTFNRVRDSNDEPRACRERAMRAHEERRRGHGSKLAVPEDPISNELRRQTSPFRRGTRVRNFEIARDELHQAQELNLLSGRERLTKRRVARLELPKPNEKIELVDHEGTFIEE